MSNRNATRRAFLTCGALALALIALPRRGRGEEPGWRELTARPGTIELRGAATPIHGFDGGMPGPVLRVRRGGELKLRLVNALPQATTIHWHGVRLPSRMDGVAGLTQPAIAPGESFDCRFTPPDAGTFWYRAASRSTDGPEHGLYGALIVDEPQPPEVDHDLLLMIDSWPLPGGTGTEQLIVNGRNALDIPVRLHDRLRLRLVNAAPGRLVALRVEGHRPLVMAIDGQPAEPFPARESRVVLAPGNRFDLLVDAAVQPGGAAAIVVEGPGGDVPVARLTADETPGRAGPRPAPRPWPDNPLPARMDLARAVRLDWSFSPAPLEPGGKPLASVKRGRTITVAFPNRGDRAQVVHVHGHAFRLLDNLDDGWKPFWLDTMAVLPGQTARIAFLADNPGKWLIESRALGEPALPASAWFEVT
jgi:FtsP/CotA-like multicopper oxidase with cupredoxin domain